MQRVCPVLLSVAIPAVQQFSILTHKRNNLKKKKVFEHKMRGLILSAAFV
jgi:hypothetical protein